MKGMTIDEWREHFETLPLEQLRRLENSLAVLMSDVEIRERYRELSVLGMLVKDAIELKTEVVE